MKNLLCIICVLMTFSAALVSCSGNAPSSGSQTTQKPDTTIPDDPAVPAEIFDDADRPEITHDAALDYELLQPWNYDKPANSSRLYPLVVSLHGSGGSHYRPCIVGNSKEMQDHPCFFLSPTCYDWGSSADWVRTLIMTLQSTYRIDPNRIYLMGFSMGGSGSYTFAKAFYSEKGGIFAGIVRLAGQSETDFPTPIADKTSVWYHIGLTDDELRVTIAEQAYQFLKGYAGNASAVETTFTDTLSGYSRLTKTLTKNNISIMKKSEYTGMGHDASVPFEDPSVLNWLFNQSLLKR